MTFTAIARSSRSVFRGARLASATVVAAALLPPATVHAQRFAVVVTQTADPAMQNLSIPDGADVHGMWSSIKNWPLIGLHASMLPNGKVLTYGSPDGVAVQEGRVYDLWDPARGFGGDSHVTLNGVTNVNSFCSATTFLESGSVLITGGIFGQNGDATSARNSVVVSGNGTQLGSLGRSLAYDRYYASMITLSDGRPLIVGGSYPYGNVNNVTPEVYNAKSGWSSLFGAADSLVFSQDQGRFWYPRLWQGPNGRVFGVSADQMWQMDVAGNGRIELSGILKRDRTGERLPSAMLPNVGPTSTAVMYDIGRIVQMGGNGAQNGEGTYSSSAATIIDINGAQPVLREAAPMILGRQWPNSVVLPTGTVMVSGGALYADEAGWSDARPVELWDKNTNNWTLGASAGAYRGYHSSDLLLQNGTVLINGGGIPGPVNNFSAEVYYPPYLFQRINGQMQLAPRPQFISLDTNKLVHGQPFRVELANANPIRSVAFIRGGQSTHSFDTAQRYIPARYVQTGTTIIVTAPANGAIAPPGYYHLVAVNADGVPSPSVIVALGRAMAAPPGPTTTLIGAVSTAANAGVTGGGVQVMGPSYEWRNCVGEGGICANPSALAIRFGIGNSWSVRMATSLACSNAMFGDPAYGHAKRCQYLVALNPQVKRAPGVKPAATPEPTPTSSSVPPSTPVAVPDGTWAACAGEGEICHVPAGTIVRHGVSDTYVARKLGGATPCTNDVFGDPLYGFFKGCDRLVAVTPTPSPA